MALLEHQQNYKPSVLPSCSVLHLMLLQNPPHGLLSFQLLLSPQVEDQQSQQDEEKHHTTYCGSDGRARSEQKQTFGLFLHGQIDSNLISLKH